MWGSWLGITFTGLLVALLVIALAFGTSGLLFPVLIAAAVAALIAMIVVGRRVGEAAATDEPPSGRRNPSSGGAPASGEGSGSPTSSTGTAG